MHLKTITCIFLYAVIQVKSREESSLLPFPPFSLCLSDGSLIKGLHGQRTLEMDRDCPWDSESEQGRWEKQLLVSSPHLLLHRYLHRNLATGNEDWT